MFRYDVRSYGLRNQSSDQFAKSSAWLPATLLAAVLTFGSFVSDARSAPLDEAEIFFELNNTDGDLGIHALIDGNAWSEIEIKFPTPDKTVILRAVLSGALLEQGLTEFFFESAEPTFDELDPLDFFDRFPEGTYRIEATSLDGPKQKGMPEVTHLMPAPAGGILVSGTAIDPESVDCDEGPVPVVTPAMDGSILISWDAVMQSHPTLGDPQGSTDIDIHNYQVVVEVETASEEEVESSVILPPDTTSLPVQAEFIALDDDGQIKFEILAREESFNQTAVESCFIVP